MLLYSVYLVLIPSALEAEHLLADITGVGYAGSVHLLVLPQLVAGGEGEDADGADKPGGVGVVVVQQGRQLRRRVLALGTPVRLDGQMGFLHSKN